MKTGAVPGRETSFLSSLAIQLRVIRALLMREVITRFGRHNIGVLWLVGEPMMFTLGVAALWSAAGLSHGSGLPIVAFAITGYSSVLMWRNTVSRLQQRHPAELQPALPPQRAGDRRLRHPDHARDRRRHRRRSSCWRCSSSLGEWIQPPEDLLMVVGGWLMLAWFGAALALTVGAATAYSEIVERLWHPTSYLLFPLSGAAFMVDWLPPGGQEVVLLLPMVHGVEMVREGYFGNIVRTHYDIGYMAIVLPRADAGRAVPGARRRPPGRRRNDLASRTSPRATARASGRAPCWTAST